jgi:hypothetical protein
MKRVLFLISVLLVSSLAAKKAVANTKFAVHHDEKKKAVSLSKDEKMIVHIICHSHGNNKKLKHIINNLDDVGWLKTVDNLFYGANNTIQWAGV